MKKIILALALSALLSLGSITSLAEELLPVKAVDGNVTISAAVDAADGTPVLIFVLPAIIEDEEDVTAEKVQGSTTVEMLSALSVEYIGFEYASSGKVEHSCVMKSGLGTGIYHVVLNYLGSEEGCYSAGTFEHLGKTDKDALVNAMNSATKDTCGAVIDEDMYGKITDAETGERDEPVEVLRKSYADVAYYDDLEETEKAKFHELLYTLKGEESFDLPLLVECFDEAGVWTRLCVEEDTLSVLKSYNGEGSGKYWNLEIGEKSDFAVKVSETEKTAILDKIKDAGYWKKETLEKNFHDEVVMSLFRAIKDRDELTALISENGKYAADFADVRTIVSDADLDEYEEALYYNNIIDGISADLTTMENVKSLFTTKLPEKGSDDNNKDVVSTPVSSNSGSSSIKYNNEVVVKPVEPTVRVFAFKDVAENHWAYSYVKNLHESGAINGISANEFAPSASVARQDFVKILIGALGMETSKSSSQFTDVEANSYYAPFVMTAFEKGIITGVGEGSFGVGVSIKREDAAVIMDRVLSIYNKEVSKNNKEFSDIENAADYAAASIARVSAAGIFSGDENGNFNPKANLSRAEACAILCRLAEMVKGV